MPSSLLQKDAPSNQINLADLTAKGRFLVVGVPGAFSPGCSQRHIPEYIKDMDKLKAKGIEKVYVVAVNDSFVTGHWATSLLQNQPARSADFVEILADPKGEFAKAWDVLFDASKFFGNERSKRFAAVIKDGKVESAFVEPDSTGIDVSSAAKVLEKL